MCIRDSSSNYHNNNPQNPPTYQNMAFNDMYSQFDDMPIQENLLRGIYAYGFEKPSDVQQRIIGPIIKGTDITVRAAAGTGKTAAYCVCLLYTSPSPRDS
eukprot:TRINITY_DN33401_c0_g1_i1.p1 TRINITY_DN33401_c0_g1~~TRINITY_DN33401_c0_g1_i1.p1  ORF type:complete len:100 (+),score=32.85 TRINITY_DN33401_c0_g1_i1:85-384(+)